MDDGKVIFATTAEVAVVELDTEVVHRDDRVRHGSRYGIVCRMPGYAARVVVAEVASV